MQMNGSKLVMQQETDVGSELPWTLFHVTHPGKELYCFHRKCLRAKNFIQEELESKELYCFHRKCLRAKNFTASTGSVWEQRTLLLPQEVSESKELYCFRRKSLRAKNFTAYIKVKNRPYSATAQDTKTCSKAHWRALWSTLHSNTEASCTCTWAYPPPRQSDRTQTLPLHG